MFQDNRTMYNHNDIFTGFPAGFHLLGGGGVEGLWGVVA